MPLAKRASPLNAKPIHQPTGPSISASPVLAPEQFREAMSRVAGSVHLVTTDGAAGRAGLTATAVTSVSDAPPTLLLCLNHASRTLAILRENGRFAVNALCATDEPIARVFAARAAGDGMSRFQNGDWSTGAFGQPLLASALAGFELELAELKPVASHVVAIGEIRSIRLGASAPALVYARRTYFGV